MCVDFWGAIYFWNASPPIQTLISSLFRVLNFIKIKRVPIPGRRHLLPPAHKSQILHPKSGSSSLRTTGWGYFLNMQENDMIIINFLSTANGRMWLYKMWMKIGPGCRRGGEAPASFANALSPLCRVFWRGVFVP